MSGIKQRSAPWTIHGIEPPVSSLGAASSIRHLSPDEGDGTTCQPLVCMSGGEVAPSDDWRYWADRAYEAWRRGRDQETGQLEIQFAQENA